MGCKTKTKSEKKGKLSITISSVNFQAMENGGINKSQLINWLLERHFNILEKQ